MTKILLISFDDTAGYYSERWFKKISCEILEAKNKSEVIKLMNQNIDIKLIMLSMDMDSKKALSIISYLKSIDIRVFMIAVSQSSDFNLAREAFRHGVSDYMLYSELNSGYFKKLQARFSDIENKKSQEATTSSTDLSTSKDRLLKHMLEVEKNYDMEDAMNKFGIKLKLNNLILCYLWVDDFQSISEKYDGNTIGDFSDNVKRHIDTTIRDICCGESVVLSPQEYLLFMSLEYNNMEDLMDRVYDIITVINTNLHDSMEISVSTGISSLGTGDKNIRELYEEARYNVKLRFVFGKGTIITPEISKKITPKKIDSIFGKEEKFIRTLIEADKEKAQYELEVLLKLIRNSDPGRLDKIYASYMEIIYIIIKFINEKCYDTVEVFGQNLDFYDIIAKFETQEEINEWIKDITDIVVSYLKEKRDVKVNRAILRVQEFIRNNYHNDLTLKMASDFVGLSESHLSNIFTKKTGQTFTDYLTSVRIEKAKELLETTNLKVYEVGVSIGYANVEHFSRVFKKFTGLSPNNYKNS
ncbi:helix-turn-helix domain-containing protein [Pseudobacteroides cellulosolvens]|uniref:Stage 0 sporulation protein A homolog n=1 Tax=Pseudobacteroides cellulosolvens ATCC 35603 = DSM 2933 TaxID=398512 RepID=A0A0L6JI45_9FIRM|nr:helix-turn-helix domain-containing protein [Pseudobacteroides cellulosolvens]KNY25404.1 two component transcriptional regulator, AraC family [Pseudobacteroides cellulosolvens ATCC 35603 = DSM 2933]